MRKVMKIRTWLIRKPPSCKHADENMGICSCQEGQIGCSRLAESKDTMIARVNICRGVQ